MTKKYLFSILVVILFCQCEDNLIPENENGYSCGELSHKEFVVSDTVGEYYYITGASLIPLDKRIEGEITNFIYCRELRNQVQFELRANYIMIDSIELKSIANVRDGIKKGEVVNPLDKGYIGISKKMKYRGREILPNQNIRDFTGGNYTSSFSFPSPTPYNWQWIVFYLDEFEFPDGECIVEVKWKTTEEKIISDTVKVYFNLNSVQD